MGLQLVELGPKQSWTLQHWCQKHDCPLQVGDRTTLELDDLGREFLQEDNRYCPEFTELSNAQPYSSLEDADKWYEENECCKQWTVKPSIYDADEEAVATKEA